MSAIWSKTKKVNTITFFIKKSVNRLTYFVCFSVRWVNDIWRDRKNLVGFHWFTALSNRPLYSVLRQRAADRSVETCHGASLQNHFTRINRV